MGIYSKCYKGYVEAIKELNSFYRYPFHILYKIQIKGVEMQMKRWTRKEKLEFIEDTKTHTRVYIAEKWGIKANTVGYRRKSYAEQLGIDLEPKRRAHTNEEKLEFLNDCDTKPYSAVARKWGLAESTIAVYKRLYCKDLGIKFIRKDRSVYTKEDMEEFLDDCKNYKYDYVSYKWGVSVKCVTVYKRVFSERLGVEFDSKRERKKEAVSSC